MIIEANERGSGAELAVHLMNARENEHVTMHCVEGFIATDLAGAFTEAEAISRGTKCQKYLFSVSLNPPPDAVVNVDAFEAAIAQIEQRLGLVGQPRAVVFHEKNGRRHAHAVWSRIDAGRMKAINISHYKRKLTELSRELYLTHGWDMPAGFKRVEDRDPLNRSRAEAMQAKRLKRDPESLKRMFRACWAHSDSKAGFEAALRAEGFVLARGDRRGFVAVDADGKIWSLSRWCGVKPKDLRARLGAEQDLLSVQDVMDRLAGLKAPETIKPDPKFDLRKAELVAQQRAERDALIAQQAGRKLKALKARLPRGVRAAFLKVTGQWARIVKEAEAADAREHAQDRQEQHALIQRHLTERRALAHDFGLQHLPRDTRQSLKLPRDDMPLSARALQRDPALVLEHLSKTEASFTRTDVLRALSQRITNPALLPGLADKALASSSAVKLSDDRVARYTTQDYLAAEAQMSRATATMAGHSGFKVDRAVVHAAISAQNKKMYRAFGGKLSDEQTAALHHALNDKQLSNMVGLAGAGKSTMLEAAAEAWTRQRVTVHGAALAGKAADGLEAASGIKSRTLASLEMSWAHGNDPIVEGDVLVLDEAGMIGTRQMARVTQKMQEIGAKLVLIGDPEQLQPIEAGKPFRDIVAKQGAAELKEIYRQRNDWQKEASRNLADGETHRALKTYEDKDAVTRVSRQEDAVEALAARYAIDAAINPAKTQLAFAHRRKDVHALNVAIREQLRDSDAPPDTMLTTETGKRAFAPGDRMVFGRNNKELGVKNGMLGTLVSASETKMSVQLDGETKRKVTFDPTQYRHIDHGYAVTIHKAQGATVDRSYVLGSRRMDQHLAYVAMTRHRDELQVFLSQEERPTWSNKTVDRERRTPTRDGPSMG